MEKMNQVYLSIGTNLGDKLLNIDNCINQLNNKVGNVLKISSCYQNPPLGFESESDFINICALIETNLNPIELLAQLKKIESDLGRKKISSERYESRIIDIDIVYYNQEIINNEVLQIPHPEMKNRKFVLVPLKEVISIDFIDPIEGKTILDLLHLCKDQSQVLKIN